MEQLIISLLTSLSFNVFGPIETTLFVLCATIVTYILFIIAMKLIKLRERGEAKWYHYVVAVPVLIPGFPLDILVNVIIGSSLFREFPQEWLFTSRLDRHARAGSIKAQWICKRLLNPFDKCHCYDGTEECE